MNRSINSFMDGAEAMSDARYGRLNEILGDHKRRLQWSLSMRLNEVRAHNQAGKVIEALDAADASASDLDQYFDIALAEMATQASRHADQALARLESGDYRVCTDCNEPIAGKRLRALPFVVRCRACEELHEIGERARRLSVRSHDSVLADDRCSPRLARHERNRSDSRHGGSIR